MIMPLALHVTPKHKARQGSKAGACCLAPLGDLDLSITDNQSHQSNGNAAMAAMLMGSPLDVRNLLTHFKSGSSGKTHS